jgi:hypothetical protein
MNKRTFLLAALCLAVTAMIRAQNTYPWPASGNVGIGTTTPDEKLVVTGDGAALKINSGSNPSAYNTRIVTNYDWSRPTQLFSNGTEILRTIYASPMMLDLMPTGGNVGIGTTNPLAKLHIVGAQGLTGAVSTGATNRPTIGTSLIDGEIHAYDIAGALGDGGLLRLSAGGGTNANVKSYIDLTGYNQTSDFGQNVSIGTSGVERVRVNSFGNVGIGAANPAAHLEVRGTNGNTGSGGDIYANAENSYIGVDAWNSRLGFVKQWGNYPVIGADNSSPIIFGNFDTVNLLGTISSSTAFTERMRITQTGNIGIGTTNPTQKLSVNGTILAKEVIVQTSWSDYVFAKDYKLRPMPINPHPCTFLNRI